MPQSSSQGVDIEPAVVSRFEPLQLTSSLMELAQGPEDFPEFLQKLVETIRAQVQVPAAAILSWDGSSSAVSVVSPAVGIPLLRVSAREEALQPSRVSPDSDQIFMIPLEIRGQAWGVLQLIESKPGQTKEQAPSFHQLGPLIAGIVSLRKQRDEAVASGEMVRKIAEGGVHDLNNILTALMGNVDLSAFSGDESSPFQRVLCMRMDDRLKTLRLLLRSAQLQLEDSSLAMCLRTLVQELMSAHPALASLRFEWDLEEDCSAPVARDIFSRAIENLLLNAGRALHGKGKITLRLRGNVSAAAYPHFLLPKGSYAHLIVEDDGPGIPESIRSMIFLQSVTTQPLAEGHGLGLLNVQAMIEDFHDGRVFVESSTSQPSFTRFHLFLPQDPGSKP